MVKSMSKCSRCESPCSWSYLRCHSILSEFVCLARKRAPGSSSFHHLTELSPFTTTSRLIVAGPLTGVTGWVIVFSFKAIFSAGMSEETRSKQYKSMEEKNWKGMLKQQIHVGGQWEEYPVVHDHQLKHLGGGGRGGRGGGGKRILSG